MEAAAHALQRMYRGCVGAAQCLMDVVGTEIEPAAPSGGDPAAAAGTAGARHREGDTVGETVRAIQWETR
jgi:hypothetical protein